MKALFRNCRINSRATPGSLLNEMAIEAPFAERLERLEEATRREAYKRATSRATRREIRAARQNGTNAPLIDSITPPGAECRAVIHDPRFA